MALNNEEIIVKIKEKLARKNKKIKAQEVETARLKKQIEQLESQLEEAFKKMESRENLIDTISDILSDDEE